MLKLYDNPASPYCRKVQVLLRETGQLDQVEMAHAMGHPLAPEKMPTSENPLGKIPTLVRDEGPALYDSRVICRYLDALGGGGLYPETRQWEVMTLEATADGIMDAAILMVYEVRSRPEDKRFDGWVEAHWDKVTRALAAIESKWMVNLTGPLDMGQIAVSCALGYLDFRHGDRDWRKHTPQLAAWFQSFGERPSMQDTVPQA